MPQRATPPPQRTRIDWGAAEAFFIGLGQGQRTYLKVARQFKVSEVTVRKWARRLDWPTKAAEVDAELAEKARRDAVRTIEQRNARTVELTEKLRDLAIEKTAAGAVDPNVAVRALPRYLQVEQLLAGEATERIEVSEFNTVLQAVVLVAERYLPDAVWEDFKRELRVAVGGLTSVDGQAAA